MGREIRRVPPDWEHPRYDGFEDTAYEKHIGSYRPLFDDSYQHVSEEWIRGFLAWIEVGRPNQKHIFMEGRDPASLSRWEEQYAQWIGREYESVMYWEQDWSGSSLLHPGGEPPDPNFYRQREWSEEEATAYQVYETVSEGTPVSPVCPTEAELITWLENEGMSEEGARKFIEMGSVPSMIFSPTGGLKSNLEIAEQFSDS